MKVRPLHDRLLIERLGEDDKTAGGLHIPDTAKEKPQRGKVIAVGEGKRDDQGRRIVPDVKPGDTVLFGKYAGTEIQVDGEERLIMREDEVLGVIGR